jgi:hypothetical protein
VVVVVQVIAQIPLLVALAVAEIQILLMVQQEHLVKVMLVVMV